MPDPTTQMSLADAEEAARACYIKMSQGKRAMIRSLEVLLYPMARAVDWLGQYKHEAPREPEKILVVEYWNIGDVVMLLPFLKGLRASYPNARITMVTNPKVVPLIQSERLVDELVLIRAPWVQHHSRWMKVNPFSLLWVDFFRCLSVLRRQDFDLGFCGRPDLRDNFVLWASGVKRRVGYGFGGGGFLLTDRVKPDVRKSHQSALWFHLLEYLGKPLRDRTPSLTISSESKQFARRLLDKEGVSETDLVVGVHAGARRATRQWGQENFRAVATAIASHFPVKILWFEEPGSDLTRENRNAFLHVSQPLHEFMAMLSCCNLLICNDSGPMHIAAAIGLPVVAVFGPGEPSWFAPLTKETRIVIQPGFWCRPCLDRCIFDQPYCLRSVSVEMVVDATEGLLRRMSTQTALSARKELT